MPIVRITLPAEKRALREKMGALGLGPPRDRRGVRTAATGCAPAPPGANAHGWSLREAAAQINAYNRHRGPGSRRHLQHDRPAPVRARELARPRPAAVPAAAPRPTCWPCSPRLTGCSAGD